LDEEERMPSQLIQNDAVYFLVSKPLKWRDHEYSIGEEFPQEEANNIETLVRSRYLLPVVDDIKDKPKAFHREVLTREQADAKLNQTGVQIVLATMPTTTSNTLEAEGDERQPEDVAEISSEVPGQGENPNLTPEAQEEADQTAEAAAEEVHTGTYDPSIHTVTEVIEYMDSHPDEREAIIEAEEAGKNRKGIVEGY
jgi:hypothetical protein